MQRAYQQGQIASKSLALVLNYLVSVHKVGILAVCLSFRPSVRPTDVRNLSDGFTEGFPTRFTCGNDSLWIFPCIYKQTLFSFFWMVFSIGNYETEKGNYKYCCKNKIDSHLFILLCLHTQADSPRREEQIEKHALRQPVQEGGFR